MLTAQVEKIGEVDKEDFEIFVVPQQLKNTPRLKELKELNGIRGIKRIFKRQNPQHNYLPRNDITKTFCVIASEAKQSPGLQILLRIAVNPVTSSL